jgi:hypothetical protein
LGTYHKIGSRFRSVVRHVLAHKVDDLGSGGTCTLLEQRDCHCSRCLKWKCREGSALFGSHPTRRKWGVRVREMTALRAGSQDWQNNHRGADAHPGKAREGAVWCGGYDFGRTLRCWSKALRQNGGRVCDVEGIGSLFTKLACLHPLCGSRPPHHLKSRTTTRCSRSRAMRPTARGI